MQLTLHHEDSPQSLPGGQHHGVLDPGVEVHLEDDLADMSSNKPIAISKGFLCTSWKRKVVKAEDQTIQR